MKSKTKYIILIGVLIFIGVGCNDVMQDNFDRCYDSSKKYYYCLSVCHNDSLHKVFEKKAFAYSDSVNYFYSKMYPEKLKQQQQEKQQEQEKYNCNCK